MLSDEGQQMKEVMDEKRKQRGEKWMTGEEKKNKKEGWKIGMEEASRKKNQLGGMMVRERKEGHELRANSLYNSLSCGNL